MDLAVTDCVRHIECRNHHLKYELVQLSNPVLKRIGVMRHSLRQYT